MARFRFGHQDEDADDGSDFVVRADGPAEQRWTFVCWMCSHLNPADLDECEVCGLERDDL